MVSENTKDSPWAPGSREGKPVGMMRMGSGSLGRGGNPGEEVQFGCQDHGCAVAMV